MSVDVVASSDVSVSLTLDKRQRETQDIQLLVVRTIITILGLFETRMMNAK